MPRKREILESLKRSELQDAVEAFDLEVSDRRVRDELVEALARSKKARPPEILEMFPRKVRQAKPGRGGRDVTAERKPLIATQQAPSLPGKG